MKACWTGYTFEYSGEATFVPSGSRSIVKSPNS